ncbi:MAG TPA: hypothetical protein VL122_05465 [Nitrospirota bacterium]|nr:hypothetical protein [Nitrospirota bacterium]
MKRTGKVKFINTEDDGVDMIVSFAIRHENPIFVKSLILLRSPKYEPFLLEHERGVDVSLEGVSAEDDRILLKTIKWEKGRVLIENDKDMYELDISAVDDEDIHLAKQLIRKMNFDLKFIMEDE